MIDICIVNYVRYDVLNLALEHMNSLSGDYRIFIADNTPNPDTARLHAFHDINPNVHMAYVSQTPGSYEGLSHGVALDVLKHLTEAPIIGTMDPDFFWIDPQTIETVEEVFSQGVQALGCAGWYPDWQKNLDPVHPDRKGDLAPVVWGQFLSREVAMVDTFATTPKEMQEVRETGWKIRRYIIENNIPTVVLPGFRYPNQLDRETCFFGSPEKPVGMHLLKGTVNFRPGGLNFNTVKTMLKEAKELWT